MTQTQTNHPETPNQGLKFFVNIEGTKHPWPKSTITTEDVAELGGWDPSVGVLLIDKDNNERTLTPGEIIEIKPGMGFAKKVRFRRGDIQDRIEQELEMLQGVYRRIILHGKEWVMLSDYDLPPQWTPDRVSVCFQIPPAYPGTPPYGLYVDATLQYQGRPPDNYQNPAANQPPFAGTWSVLSWQPDPASWRPAAEPRQGPNLLDWVRSFARRFHEGH